MFLYNSTEALKRDIGKLKTVGRHTPTHEDVERIKQKKLAAKAEKDRKDKERYAEMGPDYYIAEERGRPLVASMIKLRDELGSDQNKDVYDYHINNPGVDDPSGITGTVGYNTYRDKKRRLDHYVFDMEKAGRDPYEGEKDYDRRYEIKQEEDRRKALSDHYGQVFRGNLQNIPIELDSQLSTKYGRNPKNRMQNERKACDILAAWAVDTGRCTRKEVASPQAFARRFAAELKAQGVEVDMEYPGFSVYKHLSAENIKNEAFNEKRRKLLNDAYMISFKNFGYDSSSMPDLSEIDEKDRPRLSDDLQIVSAEALHNRRRLQPVFEKIESGLDYRVSSFGGLLPPLAKSSNSHRRSPDPEEIENRRYIYPFGPGKGKKKNEADEAIEILFSMPEQDRQLFFEYLEPQKKTFLQNLLRAPLAGAADTVDNIRNMGLGALTEIVDEEKGRKIREEIAQRAQFKKIAFEYYSPLVNDDNNIYQRGAISFAYSAPAASLAFVPYAGVPFMLANHGGESYTDAVLANPHASSGAQFSSAMLSGAMNIGANYFGAKVVKVASGFAKGSGVLGNFADKLKLGKLPPNAVPGVMNRTWRAGASAVASSVGIFVEEGLASKGEELADPLAHSMVSLFTGYDPNVDWEKVWKKFRDRGENLEMFVANSYFALLGASSRFIRESPFFRELPYHEDFLRNNYNATDQDIHAIRREQDVLGKIDVTSAITYKYMQDNVSRDSTTSHSVDLSAKQEHAGTQAGASIEFGLPRGAYITWDDSVQTSPIAVPGTLLQSIGIAPVTPIQGWGRTTWQVDFGTGKKQTFSSQQSAEARINQEIVHNEARQIDALRRYAAWANAEQKNSSGFQDGNSKVSLAETVSSSLSPHLSGEGVVIDMQASLPYKMGEKAFVDRDSARKYLSDQYRAIQEYRTRLWADEDTASRGLSGQEAQSHYDNLVANANEVQARAFEVLYKGGDVVSVFKDAAIGFIQPHLKTERGINNMQYLLREAGTVFGKQYVSENAKASSRDIVKGYSALLTDIIMDADGVKLNRMPPPLRTYIRQSMLHTSQALETTSQLRQLEASTTIAETPSSVSTSHPGAGTSQVVHKDARGEGRRDEVEVGGSNTPSSAKVRDFSDVRVEDNSKSQGKRRETVRVNESVKQVKERTGKSGQSSKKKSKGKSQKSKRK